ADERRVTYGQLTAVDVGDGPAGAVAVVPGQVGTVGAVAAEGHLQQGDPGPVVENAPAHRHRPVARVVVGERDRVHLAVGDRHPAYLDIRPGPADAEDAACLFAADGEVVRTRAADGQVVGDREFRSELDGALEPGGELDDVSAWGRVGLVDAVA